MYTEILLVLVHNVASFPLESSWTIDVFIFVLDDQWCMISVTWRRRASSEWKKRTTSWRFIVVLFFICFVFFQDTRRKIFFLSLFQQSPQECFPIGKRSFQLNYWLFRLRRHQGWLSIVDRTRRREREERRSWEQQLLLLLLVVVWRTISS